MEYFEKQVSSDVVFKGRIITVRKDNAELINGNVVNREVVEHPGGVGIVPVDSEGNVIVAKQFRYPIEEEIIEIPAGKLEYGEDPFECAVRELSEETGCTADEYTYLGAIYPSPGYCKETLYIYMATGLKQGNIHLDEDEFLSTEKISLKKLYEMIMEGKLQDAKTIIGVMKAAELLRDKYLV